MRILVAAGFAALALSGAAVAQSAPGRAAVVDQCAVVATNQEAGDASTDGQCIAAAQSYLAGLLAAGAPNLDEEVAFLVGELGALAQQDEVCNAFDTEIAEAINVSSTYSADQEANLLFASIAETIGACEEAVTAAIDPEPSPG